MGEYFDSSHGRWGEKERVEVKARCLRQRRRNHSVAYGKNERGNRQARRLFGRLKLL